MGNKPTEFSKRIGRTLRRLREQRGWSQEECGVRAGWGKGKQGRIGNYEAGLRIPEQDDVRDLAAAFNEPVSRIMQLPTVGKIHYALVPMLEWDALMMNQGRKKLPLIRWPSITPIPPHAQVSTVPDASMAPQFNAGELILVDATQGAGRWRLRDRGD
jgi:transcriptional regulator with XRE-family HTH domain